MKGLLKIRPGFDAADQEIEALFDGEPIDPPGRQPGSGVEAPEDFSNEPER
jgi:hypothetical protein